LNPIAQSTETIVPQNGTLTPANNTALLRSFFRTMVMSREIDSLEEQYTGRGEAFFHVSGAGHEAVIALNPFLQAEDYLHCHYRDKSLMLARGLDPIQFFHSLFCKDASHSRGRQMSAHMSDPTLNILSLVGPVGNNALQAVGVAQEIKGKAGNPLVLCAMGDGTTQESEVLAAMAEAVRSELPVLFLVENNKYAISTTTQGKTFFSLPDGNVDSFYGMPILEVDGTDVLDALKGFEQAVQSIRQHSKPVVVLFHSERLSNHTNADDHKVYRSQAEIQQIRQTRDPITLLKEHLVKNGVAEAELEAEVLKIRAEMATLALQSQRSAEPAPVFDARIAYAPNKEECLGLKGERNQTMLETIRNTLGYWLEKDQKVVLYGEDIEDPKGDVFGVTKGLSTKYPARVINSPLCESTIVGVAVGRALAGGKPVAFLQFADFLPIALNQIISEMGSMYWRTDGAWQSPVIVMISCGGYKPGLGPFHAQSFEALGVHTPGVDVVMPSTAYDAAGLLNAAFESNRPTLFFYPKSCLNDRSATTSPDVENHWILPGKARMVRTGKDLTMVGYGNTISRCTQAAAVLEQEGITTDVIDLRSLAPWDEATVINSCKKTGKLIIVHEDNVSCGMGSEIAATVAEKCEVPVIIRRVARADTYVPCNFSNQLEVLPSYQRVLEVAATLFGIEVQWIKPPEPEVGTFFVDAVGTSPSDESVTVTEWLVKVGEEIKQGQMLASYEADKASAELLSSIAGIVEEVLVPEGQSVKVGTPILKIKLPAEAIPVAKPITQENPGQPVLKLVSVQPSKAENVRIVPASTVPVGLSGLACVKGSITVTNDDIVANFPGKSADDIVKGTGIESRQRMLPGENILDLAAKAAAEALQKQELAMEDMDLVLVSTGTPGMITPSLACRLMAKLAPNHEAPAYDFSAACSGYLYGLNQSWDYLQQNPDAKILLVTAEALSSQLDATDYNTAIIFGDAATASIITGGSNASKARILWKRPVLSGKGEDGSILRVPQSPSSPIFMNGSKVFSEGVRKMTQMIREACRKEGIDPASLDWVIPHQANQRIIDAIRSRLNVPEEKVFSNIKNLGNTSSNTIALCLNDLWHTFQKGEKIGLAAFGGGFTYAAVLGEVQ
jgi:2-oxoisovalerate dehydrogenase E1 component